MVWSIERGDALLEGALRLERVAMAEGVFAADPPAAARRFDASGLYVLPGLVDIHGDAHERQMQPRPGIGFPHGLGMRDSAAQLLAAGITTACLGVTLSWEPGLRGIAAWRATLAAVEALRPQGGCDLRIHCRYEADNLDVVEELLTDMEAGRVALLAFNDHTPGIVKRLPDPAKAASYAQRGGVAVAEITRLAEAALARRAEVPAAHARLAAAARANGIPMLSHDDATPEARAHFRDLGAKVCEFPMSEAVAEAARAAGEHVVMGAPNVVRGGSHMGWGSAAPMAEQGHVTILASDYYWPAMLEAAFVLAGRGVLDLPSAWALVSANPAEAAGLADRGRIAPGLRGDLVLVDPARRAPIATFCQGELAWLAAEAAGRIG
ncbi:alpha-D-ribose 1-methylphosphonate 5-triphosphate diphosphatase [Falsiroseomonas tokyonensis]|uniref:Alpha-D-ribose 1-methylphosphonate 5-triphosphate diphosphatase n=1 Tax=Falsiroseomonas tokyonensis TaxID=430521 RepID=A0ABV7BRN0_9PROT|nr:alpha-D-ribose 1-methylphosphonate 5-triphosphate diphosphatase [Falsiroseomonas tokyonensis]MBU8538190.1 alpha-D-ribose 1-methylphosphonate 5-triphosphate diphosphatase [Falsiroseomonas tokyonensis]